MTKPRRLPQTDDGPLTTVGLEILLTLSEGPRHGYAIKLDVEQRGGDGFVLGSGSLYQALQRLERRGLIAEVDTDSPDARRGRVYQIEQAGRRTLAAELGRMQRVLTHARRNRLVIGRE